MPAGVANPIIDNNNNNGNGAAMAGANNNNNMGTVDEDEATTPVRAEVCSHSCRSSCGSTWSHVSNAVVPGEGGT